MKKIRFPEHGLDVSSIDLAVQDTAERAKRIGVVARALNQIYGKGVLPRTWDDNQRLSSLGDNLAHPQTLNARHLIVHSSSDAIDDLPFPKVYGQISHGLQRIGNGERTIDMVTPLSLEQKALPIGVMALTCADFLLAEAGKQPDAVELHGLPKEHREVLVDLGFETSGVKPYISVTGSRGLVLPGLVQELGSYELIDVPNA